MTNFEITGASIHLRFQYLLGFQVATLANSPETALPPKQGLCCGLRPVRGFESPEDSITDAASTAPLPFVSRRTPH